MATNLDENASWVPVPEFLQHGDTDAVSCFQRTQWDRLCVVASTAKHGVGCVLLDRVAAGLNNIVRLLDFADGSRWAARVHIRTPRLLDPGTTELDAEVATMQFIKEHSDLAVPEVYTHAADEGNPVGVAYMLIELLPGIVAMDALGGYEVHRGVIPAYHRESFYRSVAASHICMTSLRLAKIGTVIRNGDGGYEAGPLPGIGGPFETAAAFFEAWADAVKFKQDEKTITHMMQRGPIPAEEMISIIDQFPMQIKAMANRLSAYNEGPFPLCHDDFLHSNILVDEESFEVTGIIDWEGAYTVPWELVAFPDFLKAMPPAFDLSENYDRDGEPVDKEVRERMHERREYVEMVRAAEGEDKMLSWCLGSSRCQTLAYTYGAYQSVGKLGFYDQVIEEIERES